MDEVFEYGEMSALSNRFQLSQYEDVSVAVEHLAIDGYVLDHG